MFWLRLVAVEISLALGLLLSTSVRHASLVVMFDFLFLLLLLRMLRMLLITNFITTIQHYITYNISHTLGEIGGGYTTDETIHNFLNLKDHLTTTNTIDEIP
jgi:hypothetical protein